MSLTDTEIRNAKPGEKPFKLADEKGLYVLINKTGKYFRFDYRYAGKRKTLALGVYPEVSLKEARNKLDEARKKLADGIDPAQYRKISKSTKLEAAANSFQSVALEWYSKNQHTWTDGHSETVISRLQNNVFPWLGSRPISEITSPELLVVLRRIESRGAIETAHRIKQVCGQVFRFAVATGRAERDPSADLRGAMAARKPKHMAAITDPVKIAELLRAINGYHGTFIAKCAMRLAPLVFVRPGELRKAEWIEIDLDKAEWRIPAEKMKMREQHIVPLSRQAVAIFKEIEPLTRNGKYVFPSIRTNERPMSENTVLAGLHRLGYAKKEMTGHGFRAMASTRLHEMGWESDVIERQLAHGERNSVKAAYNHALYLPERRKMMQAWADYLEALAAGAQIIPMHASR